MTGDGVAQEGTLVALTTSTHKGSVAIQREDGERLEDPFPEGLVHGREAIPRLKALLERAGVGVDTITRFAVDIGPGSYTGVRVGVALAKSVAFACEARLVGFSSLEILAGNARSEEAIVCSLLDARRSQVYRGVYDRDAQERLVQRGELESVLTVDVVAQIPRGAMVMGDGAPLLLEACEDDSEFAVAARDLWFPSAGVILDLVGAMEETEGGYGYASSDQDLVVPLYLRPSEAELNLRRRGES